MKKTKLFINSEFNENDAISNKTNQESTSEADITSYRFQSSYSSSSLSSDSDVSLSLSMEQEHNLVDVTDADELPAFEIRLISPFGRIPSPIDVEVRNAVCDTLMKNQNKLEYNQSSCNNNPNYVALQDINAQINPPNENEQANCSRNLETIFEGVFFNTPPRTSHGYHNNSHHSNHFKNVSNQLHSNKENSYLVKENKTTVEESHKTTNFK